MIVRTSLALVALLSLVRADVEFTSPSAGASVSGTTLDVEWADSGSSPPLSSLQTYQLFLCAGGNDPSTITVLTSLTTTGDFTEGNTFSGTFQSTLGGTTKNAYFLKMISAAPGGVVINFSPRFSLPDMEGTFPVTVQSALKSVSGTSGPETQNQIASQNQGKPPAAAAPAAGDFTIPYSMQDGPTKYAPMPKRPGTKITKKNMKPLYETSAWEVFTQYAGHANADITVTAPDTVVISSMEATIAAAPMPTDSDMQKFLNRWKD